MTEQNRPNEKIIKYHKKIFANCIDLRKDSRFTNEEKLSIILGQQNIYYYNKDCPEILRIIIKVTVSIIIEDFVTEIMQKTKQSQVVNK